MQKIEKSPQLETLRNGWLPYSLYDLEVVKTGLKKAEPIFMLRFLPFVWLSGR
ncbi:hypothetical protein V144x_24160 [Gimesia aquarii]|uniref:Uncharacterized protein n=1 Tax=Gimesia aquarii TaxID=2527964 RepID=A0A517VVB6_9PLAN|nr:hypothetical protein V144x_24160 [Gimesia aquarii]